MAKAQETLDAEMLALAALVNHEAATINGDVAKYGEPQFNPRTPASIALYALLEARSVIAKEPRDA